MTSDERRSRYSSFRRADDPFTQLDRLVDDLHPVDRVELLQKLLGDGACRQLGIYPIPNGFKLSVVIPVFNEERWLMELVRRVRDVPIPKEFYLDRKLDHVERPVLCKF